MHLFDYIASKLGYTKTELTEAFFDRARKFDAVERAVGPLIGDQTLYRSLRELLGPFSGAVKTPYSQSLWVYACINVIAQNIGRVPFVLKTDSGSLSDPIEKGPLYELFQNPNPFMTQKELIISTFVYYGLRGEAFWILEGRDDVSQIPKEIYCFDPQCFDPIIDRKTKWLIGWKYKSAREELDFALSEILHFKMFNPYNNLRGLSPLEAARLSVDTDYHASVYNKVFFENGAVTSLNISVPEELTDDAYNRMVKQFEERHKSSQKAHRIAIAEGGAKITEGRMGQRDIEFIEGKRMSREEIMGAYLVNEVVLGIFKDIKSYEGIRAAHKAFWEECLIPKTAYFEDVLWSKFFSKIGARRGKGRIWGEFDLANVGPLQANYRDKVDMAFLMVKCGWPINAINKRLEMGMPDMTWGDEWWVPGTLLTATDIMSGNVPEQEPKSALESGAGKDFLPGMGYIPASSIMKRIAGSDRFQIEEKKEEIKEIEFKEETFDELKVPLRSAFKIKIKKFLFDLRKDTLAVVSDAKPWEVLYKEDRYDKLCENLKMVYVSAINSGQSSLNKVTDGEYDGGSEIIFNFVNTKSLFVTHNFKGLITNLLDALEQYKGNNGSDKEVLKGKTREIFNYLESKSNQVIKNEVDAAFAFGRNYMLEQITNQLKESLSLNGEVS